MSHQHVVVALSLLAGVAAAQAQDGPVSPAQMKATWIGKTLIGQSPSGARSEMTLSADGSARLVYKAIPYTGVWRLDDAGYCTAWQGIRDGKERCFKARRVGNDIEITAPDGSSAGKIIAIK